MNSGLQRVLKRKNTRLTCFAYLKEPVVLSILAEGENYGYNLIGLIHERYGVCVGASVMYPLLYKLKASGYVTLHWEHNSAHGRRVVAITPAGRKYFTRYVDELRVLVTPLLSSHNNIPP